MDDYDKNKVAGFVGWFFTVWALIIIVTTTIFVATKIGNNMFSDKYRGASYQEIQSLKMCAVAHGTPVLENNGDAYKSCAINGKSDTRNVVK